jgi:antitoxin component of MazEF toxin-antitoxin module
MAPLRCTARVGDDGSLSIPREALKELGVKPGDELSVSVSPATISVENTNGTKGRMMTFGMFPELQALTEEDF